MPLSDEYLRAYIEADGNDVTVVRLYPVRPFRVDSDSLQELLTKTADEASKRLADDCPLAGANRFYNFAVNEGLHELDRQGKVISTDMLEASVVNDLLVEIGNVNYINSNDGYAIFNPAWIPPTVNQTKH